MTNLSMDGIEMVLSYDSNNRLIKAGETTYTYNAENYRLSSQTGSKKYNYVYDPLGSRLLMDSCRRKCDKLYLWYWTYWKRQR